MADRRRWRDSGSSPAPPPDLTEAYRRAYEQVYDDWASYEPSAGARLAGRVGQQLDGVRHGPQRREGGSHPVARRGWVMVLAAVLGGLAGAVVTQALPVPYVASVTLLVDLPKNDVDSETIIRTVESLATSATVVDDVAAQPGVDLSPKAVGERLGVKRSVGAGVVQIFVTDPSPSRARRVADELRTVFQDRLQGYGEAVDTGSAEIGALSFTDPQVEKQDRPVLARAVLGAVVGFNLALIGVALAARRRRRQAGFRHIQM
jgi:capsular polysaccharide biosynthesis protein